MNQEEEKKIEETKTDVTTTEGETTNVSQTEQKKEDPKPTTSTQGAGEVIKPFGEKR